MTPLVAVISKSPVTMTFRAKNNHFPTTSYSADFSQILSIQVNPAPTNTSMIADQTYTVGQAISVSFSGTLFTDI